MFMLILYTEGRSFDNAVATVVHLSISSIPLVGFAIGLHEHITARSTSYMCTNIAVNLSKNVICLSKSKEPLLLLEIYACWLASDRPTT